MVSQAPATADFDSVEVGGREAKAARAEQEIAFVRLAIIVFNVAVYVWLLEPVRGREILAAAIVFIAPVYAAVVVVYQPHLRFPVLQSSAFTAITDSLLIAAWLYATGDVASPFFPLWFVSLTAVSFRYSWGTTLATTAMYLAADLAVVSAAGTAPLATALVRVFYIAIAGLLAALVARASHDMFLHRTRLEVAMAETAKVQEARRKRAAQEAELERLVAMDRFKTDFINTAAHELNTPLTPLRLQLNVLRRAGGADTRTVGILERNITRLSDLVGDMLEVARAQSDALAVALAPMDLGLAVRHTVETFEASAAEAEVTVAVAAPDVQVLGDATRVQQVLANMISNALKFTAAGGHVDVRIVPGDPVRLEVQDTGIGLSPQQKATLFQPFVRAHESAAIAGTGLGLYIARALVDKMGGEMGVESPGPDQGSTFWFSLPASQ